MAKSHVPTIQQAEALEKEARRMKQESLGLIPRIVKKGEKLPTKEELPTPEKVAEKLEDAADEYRKAKDFVKAENLYHEAITYGYSIKEHREEKKDIENKIREMRIEKASYTFPRKVTLENRFSRGAYAVASFICLVFALMFVSSNLSGYSILSINSNNSNWIGLCFFICGLLFAFFYLRKK